LWTKKANLNVKIILPVHKWHRLLLVKTRGHLDMQSTASFCISLDRETSRCD